MRRTYRTSAIAVLALVAEGCEPPPPPSPPLAARFESSVLESRRLADLMILGQPLPVDERTALRLVEHWVEASALSRAVREERDLGSDAAVAAATQWIVESRLRELVLDELVRPETIDPAAVEEVYARGDLRLVAHILRAVSPAATQTERSRQRGTARQILQFLRGGGSWEEAVQGTEDPVSAELNGLMGLYASGELEGILDRQLFSLAPGALSGIVPSDAGFHILYRPALDDVRGIYATYLQARRTAQRKAEVADSLRDAAGAALVTGAADQLAAIGLDPFRFVSDSTTLVTFQSTGTTAPSVTAAQVASRLARLSGDARRRLAEAPPSEREVYLMTVASEAATLDLATARGIPISAEEQDALALGFAAELEGVLTSLQSDAPEDVAPGTSDPVVEAYFEAFLARRVDQVTPPVGLLELLLSEHEWSVSDEGIAEAVALAQRSLDALGDRR